jgi:hypothetical protein
MLPLAGAPGRGTRGARRGLPCGFPVWAFSSRRRLPRLRRAAIRKLRRLLRPTLLQSLRAHRQQTSAVTDAERKKQIADESAKLLKLATDLKAEVDKTSKDTLSVNVIRKADEIEKLAHSVKEKMKPAAGAN